MAERELHYRWEWRLASPREALWPLLADTDRFDRATGLPPITRLPDGAARLRVAGMAIEWVEEPFEWVRPARFGVVREYRRGPLSRLQMRAELHEAPAGGTDVVYEVWATPRGILGRLLARRQIGVVSARRFAAVAHAWDADAAAGRTPLDASSDAPRVTGVARSHLDAACDALLAAGAEESLVARLRALVSSADDGALTRLRPYALADAWHVERRAVLRVCLQAVRAGLLDYRWDVLCPLCRGAKDRPARLADLQPTVHCDGCHIDFQSDLEHGVELTFQPNAAVRRVVDREFCLGGPQRTPHIVAQRTLAAGERWTVDAACETGRYRVRCADRSGAAHFAVVADGPPGLVVELDPWDTTERELALGGVLELANPGDEPRLGVVERMAYSDQAATAADVTALQVFRDLFAGEALRPGLPMGVGCCAVLFTDLRGSTALYREIGDAPAFGRVFDHFEVLREVVAEADGAVVKTMGDAVMAVFRHPAAGLRAALTAQARLRAVRPPLVLKAGLMVGPCIAVTLNDRLDYFGSTVNLAARLEQSGAGDEVVLADSVLRDPEIEALLASGEIAAQPFEATLKGFDGVHRLWRVTMPLDRTQPAAGS
jgi:class 3 adenylate cyclase